MANAKPVKAAVDTAIDTVKDAFAGTHEDAQEMINQSLAERPSEMLVTEQMSGGRSAFTEEDLRAITTFDEAIALATAEHGAAVYADEVLGDGFALLSTDGKARLVGVPLCFMEWSFYDGEFGGKFVAARVVARGPSGNVERYILNDGSTGICDQLAKFQLNKGRNGNLIARYGLRRSDYEYTDESGKTKPATTYYIDTSA